MATVFNRRFRHGRLDFHPDVPYGFEDPDAAPYFLALGVAAEADADPAVVIGIDEIDIDPVTVWASGQPNARMFVMPERAAAALGMPLEEALLYEWDGVRDLKAEVEARANG